MIVIPKSANNILKELRHSADGSLTIADLAAKTEISYQEAQAACEYLIDIGLVRRGEPREHTPDYVVITAKGRYRRYYIFNAGADFLMRSIVVPTIVSVAAAIIVVLIQCA